MVCYWLAATNLSWGQVQTESPASASAPSAAPHATSAPAPDEQPVAWTRFTGDWFGLRAALEEHGLTVEASYSFTAFVNTRGGLNTGHSDTYQGLFSLSLSLDTKAAGLWNSGTFYVNMQDVRGHSISDWHVGDLLGANNNAADEQTQLAEFWLEQSFLDGHVRTKLGKQNANADFAATTYGVEFVNSSFGLPSNVPIPAYPDPALGAALFLEPGEWFSARAGIYDADSIGRQSAFETAFHGAPNCVAVTELALTPKLFDTLPGAYRFGAWYDNGCHEIFGTDLHGRRPLQCRSDCYGVYATIDQLLIKEDPANAADTQGLGFFGQYGYAPPACNEIANYYGVGLVYTGLVPTRDADVVGLAGSYADLSGFVQRLERRHQEAVLELFYSVQLTEFLKIKPDVQYIFAPGGNGSDACVIGIRLDLAF